MAFFVGEFYVCARYLLEERGFFFLVSTTAARNYFGERGALTKYKAPDTLVLLVWDDALVWYNSLEENED